MRERFDQVRFRGPQVLPRLFDAGSGDNAHRLVRQLRGTLAGPGVDAFDGQDSLHTMCGCGRGLPAGLSAAWPSTTATTTS